ncbi:two-component regulator propeller domain-containing protein [Haliangium sp.]|uniref:hybrid sensor histidine kinase/response regulator n=1 Tax=Haliangium sp. TaxID=2663208 RepID=UPI003D0A3373
MALACALAACLFGTSPARAESYAFTVYAGDDGLSQLLTQALVQDRDGYLWIGTQAGLNRYNGRTFEIFSIRHGLLNDNINDLLDDGDGGLWIATAGGLSHYRGGRFENYQPPSSPFLASRTISHLARDRRGRLWCATIHGLARFDQGSFHTLSSIPLATISALLVDSRGRLWIGTEVGLYVIEDGEDSATPAEFLPHVAVSSLAEDDQQRLWIGGPDGVDVYRDGRFVARWDEQDGLRGLPVVSMQVDRHGAVWMASATGLAVVERDRLRFIDTTQGLTINRPQSLLEDRDGIIWVGGLGGVAKFLGRPFVTYDQQDGLIASYTRPIVRDHDGDLWVGTARGLSRWDGQTWYGYTTKDGLASDYVSDLAVDRQGRLWIASQGGLQFYADGRFQRDPAWTSSLPHDDVAVDDEGYLWLGVRDLGIVRQTAGGFQPMPIEGQTTYSRPRLVIDHRGEVWATGDAGLSHWNGDRWRTYTPDDGLAGPDPYYVYEDAQHHIWFGYRASRGVTRFDRRAFRTFTTRDGLSNDAVYSLGVGHDGALWIGTARGVDRFDGDRFRNYGTAEGYASQESNAGGFYADPDGTLWFGTAEGLSHYDPRVDIDLSEPIVAHLRQVTLGGTPVPGDGQASHAQSDLRARVDVLSFINARQLGLRYRLRGYDDVWRELEGRELYIPNLPVGEHVLEIQARRYQEPWATATSFEFHIQAPFWRTWWFAIAVALVVLGLVRFVIRIARQKSALEATLSELRVTQRQLEATNTDLQRANRVKGELVANVSHELRTPMNAVLGMTRLALETDLTAEQREYLDVVVSSGESLLTLINDILDLSRIESGQLGLLPQPFDLHEHIAELVKTMAPGAHAKGLELLCDLGDEIPHEVIGDPHRIRQILINLVGNAIKFTAEGSITIALECVADDDEDMSTAELSGDDLVRAEASVDGLLRSGCVVHISVTDTGIGIPPAKRLQIFERFSQVDGSTTRAHGGSGLGLAITRELVFLMGGCIWVDSEKGRGSTFHVLLRLELVEPEQTQPEPDADAARLLDGRRIMLIDDHPTGAEHYGRMLVAAGADTTIAHDAASAYAAMDEAPRPFDAILVDVGVEDLDIAEFLHATDDDDGHRHPRPLLLALTSPGAHSRKRASTLSMLPVDVPRLPKPILPQAMRQVLADTLGRVATGSAPDHALVDAPSRPLDVLVVEDNLLSQKLMTTLLAGAGHRVTVVGDGHDAVEAVAAGRFDVVLMDIQMPRMDGLEATQRIRRGEGQSGRRVPIIALTANTLVGDREQCLQAGMDEYVPKPIRRDHLMQAIARTLP